MCANWPSSENKEKEKEKMQRELSTALNANKQRNYDLRRLQKRLSQNMWDADKGTTLFVEHQARALFILPFYFFFFLLRKKKKEET